MRHELRYKDAGVDQVLGDEASQILYEASKLTWKNRDGKIGEVKEYSPEFGGLRAINVGGLPTDTISNINFDGVGTKIEIAERLERHDTVAFDLFAMVCDDAITRGMEPVILGSILDVNSLSGDKATNLSFIQEIADGYVAAAKEAGVAVVNGEVAELGARVKGYGSFNYNWGAGIVWFGRESKAITGTRIRTGDVIVGLKEDGFRSNGLSLAKKILETAHGEHWQELRLWNGYTLGELALTSSRIYSKAVMKMLGDLHEDPLVEIHGIAHITGGGLPGKVGRVLRSTRLGAQIEDPFEPPAMMEFCQEDGELLDEEAYRVWNMGQGMVIITPEPETVIRFMEESEVEAKVIGEIVEEPGVRIKSKGLRSRDEELNFE